MRCSFASFVLLAGVLVGCGGSGSGTAVDPAPSPTAEKGTALFEVDVASGKVKVVPLETGKGKTAVLGGNAVSFETTTLLSEGGEVGRRAVKVRLKNNLNEAIGVGRPIRIQFGVIGPAAGYQTDLRPYSTVSTPVRSNTVGFQDGPAGAALLNTPTAVAVGQDGSIYFNGSDNRIRRLQDGYVSTVATNVPATGLAYLRDSITGREYLVAPCASLHSIKLVPIASGSVTTWAGLDNTSGNANGAAGTARFNGPNGAAVDAALAQVLVADTGNGSVRGIPFTFSGGNLVAGTVLNRYSGLTNPRSVCVSSNRSVGVVETSASRIRIFNAGSSKEVIIGGTLGNSNGDGNSAAFSNPQGITAVGDTFFLADRGNRQIKRIALKNGAAPLLSVNWTVGVIAGTSTPGFDDGLGDVATFDDLQLMATDGQGRIVVADFNANGIRRLTTQGSFDFGTPNGDGQGQAQLTNPTGYADLNTLQRPYIDLAQRIEPGGTAEAGEWQFSIPPGIAAFRFAVTVETGTSVYAGLEAVFNPTGGAGSPNVVAQFLSRAPSGATTVGALEHVSFDNSASYTAFDAAGNLYVADYTGNVVRRITPSGRVTLVAGQQFSPGNVNGDGSVARLNFPAGIMVNREGTELCVADASGQTIRLIRLNNPTDNPEIAVNWTVSTIAGFAGSAGDANGAGGTARFKSPFGLAGPDLDTIYICEYNGNRVRRLRFSGGDRTDPSSWNVSTVAGSAVGDTGFADAPGGSARFSFPYGIAYSRAGTLFVADTSNHRIRAINLLDSSVTTVAGSGVSGSNDSDTPLTATIGSPLAIATDDSGAVYFSASNRVRRLLNGTVRTVAGGGDGSGTTGDKVSLSSYGMALDPRGDLVFVSSARLVRLTRKLGR